MYVYTMRTKEQISFLDVNVKQLMVLYKKKKKQAMEKNFYTYYMQLKMKEMKKTQKCYVKHIIKKLQMMGGKRVLYRKIYTYLSSIYGKEAYITQSLFLSL